MPTAPSTPDPTATSTNPRPVRWALTFGGCVLAVGAVFGHDITAIARWVMGLGGLTILFSAPWAARQIISGIHVTDEGVTAPGLLRPVHIPWGEVVRVFDDQVSITIQSATRSARIPIVPVTLRSTFGGVQFAAFNDTEDAVRFILAHIPKSAILEMNHWLPP